MALTENQVLDALRPIQDPDLHRDIVSLGFVRNVRIEGNRVSLDINLTTPACPVKDLLKKQAHDALLALPGVKSADVNMTADVRRVSVPDRKQLESVRNIVAVGSGKGGVGKSTVAANLAAALAQSGARVGLLDADIYGPTVPILFGVSAPLEAEGEVILPHERHGVRFMSMGYLAPGDQPLIWRGPMAHKALQQCLFGVRWGELDYLVVDLPPGTGDIHLTLVQTVALAGGVIVTTPQDVGLTISRKTLRMFQQMNAPVLGLVENMSFYACPHCGQRDDLFGHGSTAGVARELGVPFLGEIPLHRRIREDSDRGVPTVVADPSSEVARAYRDLSTQVAAQVSIRAYAQPVPAARGAE